MNNIRRGLIQLICVAVGAFYFWLLYRVLSFAPINPDAGYYLSVVERVREGLVPYRDFRLHYTPLGIYLLGWGANLLGGGVPSYVAYVESMLVAQILCLILTFVILRRLGLPKVSAALAAFTQGCIFIYYQGSFIELEPYVLLFTLGTIYVCLSDVALSRRCFYAGLFAALAFLSKQYGVAALASSSVLLLPAGSILARLRRGALIALGFILPLFFALTYYCVIAETSLSAVLTGVRRADLKFVLNEPWNLTAWGIEWSVAIVVIIAAFVRAQAKQRLVFSTLALAALSFVPQFMVRQSLHYFMLPSAPLFILAVYAAFTLMQKFRVAKARLLLCGFSLWCAMFVLLAGQEVLSFGDGSSRRHQLKEGEELRALLPVESRALLIADPMFFYTAQLRSFNELGVGYDYPGLHSGTTIAAWVQAATTVVVDRADTLFYQRVEEELMKNGDTLSGLLEREGFEQTVSMRQGEVEIWRRG